MERLNVKSVSVFIVLNILLVCLVSTQAMADPVQEQVECDFDLPVGPFLRLEGTDIEIDVLGQTLRGDFVFEKVTPPPPIITINPGTPTRSGLVVPIRGDDSSVGKSFAEGARVFFGGRESCAGVQAVDWHHTPQPWFDNIRFLSIASGTTQADSPGVDFDIEVDIIDLSLLAQHWICYQAPGQGPGVGQTIDYLYNRANPGIPMVRFYISSAYGTTRADVPICDFCIPYGQGIFVWSDAEPQMDYFAPPGMLPEGTNIPTNIDFSYAEWDIIITVAPGGTLDMMNSAGGGQAVDCYSTQKGLRTLKPEPEFCLHYDSGKADGSVGDARNTVLGYGWTHNYNLYLVRESSDIFMADGKGRMTRFKKDGSNYIPSDGQTHTLIEMGPTAFLLEEIDGTTMSFEQPGIPPEWAYGKDVYLVTKIEDARGRAIDFFYNPVYSLLETITDPYGRQIQLDYFDYPTGKRLWKITDPNIQVTMLDYQAGGEQLRCVTDPGGNTLTYNYDPNNRMTTAQLKDGNTWTCEYEADAPWRRYIKDHNNDVYATVENSENWLPDPYHPDSNEIRYKPSQTTITDGEGNITTLDLDKNGYVTAVGHPGHPNETFVFDSNLRLTEYTDQENNSWQYEYDANGNLTDVNDPLDNHTEMFYGHSTIPSLLTKVIESDGDIWQFEWNPQGDLTKIIDPIVESPTDKVVDYSYMYDPVPPDGRYQFATRTDRNGNITQCEFDPQGNIVRTVADPCGLALTTEYEYDPVGRVTKRTIERDPSSSVITRYSYDSLGQLIERSVDPDSLNLTRQYEYDGCGRIIKVTNPRSIITDYDYDYRGRLVNRTFDPCGLALSTGYSYDGCDRRITTTDAECSQTNYEYDSLNRLIKIVDAEGYWTEYQYDDRSNLTYLKRTIDPGGPLYRISKYEYDSLNRLIQITADPCDLALPTQIGYAPSGGGSGGAGYGTSGTSIVHKVTNPEGKVTYHYYDQLDRLIRTVYKVDDINDNGGDANDATIDYEYDSVGNRIRTIVENAPEPNLVTEYSYDAANRLIKQVVDPCDANLVTNYTYDGTGSIISRTTSNGNVISYCYDAANRLTNISDSIGLVASYDYDENGNLISHSDGLGHSWIYSYDSADRIIEVYDPLIDIPTDKYATYEYDKNNNLIKETDNESLATDYEYDSLNRLISTTKDPCGLNVTNTITYDGLDNKISATDDNGNATTYEYDGLNRLIREEFADGTEMLFGYDGRGNVVSETDQLGNTTGYTYDDLNRLITRSYADGRSDTFGYDRAGQMLSADNDHSHIGHTYDGAGRTIGSTQTDLPETYNYAVGYAYTAEPNSTRTITYPDSNEVTEFYDVRSRLIKVEADGSTIALYTYDDPGNRLLAKNFDNGTQSLYFYNDNDWVTTLVHKAPDDSNLAGFEYAYDAVGNCISSRNLLAYDVSKPITQSLTCGYDAIYRLNEFKRGLYIGSIILSSTRHSSWSLDGANNWQQFSIQDTISSDENGTYNNSINQMNEYDDPSTNGPAPVPDDDGQPDDFMVNANPLEGDLQPDGEVDFNDLAVIASHWLDGCSGPGWCDGADIDQSTDVDFVDYARFAINWLDSTPGFYNSSHDKNGNLVNDDVAEYFWDYDHRSIDTAVLRAKNLLTQVKRKSDGQVLGKYLYDALGRRISKTVGTVTTVFVYDGWRVVGEYDNSIFARSLVYGNEIDEVLVVLDASAMPSYYHAEVKGSIIVVTDTAAVVSERYAYDAYGQPYFCDAAGNLLAESAIGNSYLFTGRRYDEESDLYYYRTRYLHPKRGRFISGDVIGNWGDGLNLGNNFAYAGNNPETYTDPFGLQAGVKFGPPRGPKRRRYNFRFKASSVNGKWIRKATIVISSRDALRLRRGTPAAKVLTKCKVIIISGGAANIKKG